MNNPKVYYSISNCEEHGLIRGKIRIRKTEDEKYFAVKTLRFTDTEEAEELRERKEFPFHIAFHIRPYGRLNNIYF